MPHLPLYQKEVIYGWFLLCNIDIMQPKALLYLVPCMMFGQLYIACMISNLKLHIFYDTIITKDTLKSVYALN